jgi:hypothetical protein
VSEWISTKDRLPEDSLNVYVVAWLTDEHMWSVPGRRIQYEVASGSYVNRFSRLYTHWVPLPAPPHAA